MEEVAMRKSRFSESQIVSILKENESGRQVKDICREHGISTAPSVSIVVASIFQHETY